MGKNITTKTSEAYVKSLWTRHGGSAEHRSCGDHCPPPFEVNHVGPGESVKVGLEDGEMRGKGGRGKGKGAASNFGHNSKLSDVE